MGRGFLDSKNRKPDFGANSRSMNSKRDIRVEIFWFAVLDVGLEAPLTKCWILRHEHRGFETVGFLDSGELSSFVPLYLHDNFRASCTTLGGESWFHNFGC